MSGVLSGFPGSTGWLKDNFDGRDHPFIEPAIQAKASVNLRTDASYKQLWDAPYNQLVLGSCVANAASACYVFEMKKAAKSAPAGTWAPTPFEVSRNFVYYNARSAENTPGMSDDGCMARNALKSLHQLGMCSEMMYPYPCTLQEYNAANTQAKYEELQKRAGSKSTQYPGRQAYFGAMFNRIANYQRLDVSRAVPELTIDAQKDADGEILKKRVQLALSDGHPVVFGFWYYEKNQFADSADGKTSTLKPLKTKHKAPTGNFGGHAILAIGYDKDNVICQNSWGETWNGNGLFTMPWNWITDYEATDDFWIIKGFRDITNVDDEDLNKLKAKL